MKKNTKPVTRERQVKKQSNKKIKKVSKKGSKLLIATTKKVSKKAPKKTNSKIKSTKKSKVKAKSAMKKNHKAVLKQKTKKVIRRARKQDDNSLITFGNIGSEYGKMLLLIVAIIFVSSFLIMQSMTREEKIEPQPKVAGIENTRNIVREKEINDLVQGYPIEKMTRYIAKQDPKVAAFLVAIAKKESAWGERKPVLDGEDCYNYWGFRLKSDRMGSGGHTCFDSPEEAVAIVGSRLNHLVNEEKIDTPKEMVIWKCGYACNGPEAAGSEKWIRDVDYYYKKLIN